MDFSHKIDLHIHTTFSDGTDTPEMLLTHVNEIGIELFSVTDHDTIKGSTVYPALLQKGDPAYLTGAEFSCMDQEGQYHILGYGYDPGAAALQELVTRCHAYRMNKVRSRLNALKEKYNIVFPEDEIQKLLALENPGKPHIGNLMVKYGYTETKDQAIFGFINPLHVHSEYLMPEEVIDVILCSGGIPVLAHPSLGNGNQCIEGDAMDRRLRRLIGYGLQGVEAFYSGFSEKQRNEMLAFAARYQLFITAGSDYHGTNKPVKLGNTGFDTVMAYPEGLQSFLETIRDRLILADQAASPA